MSDINAYKFKAQLLKAYIPSILTGTLDITITETARTILVTVWCDAYNFDIMIPFEESYLEQEFDDFTLQRSYRYFGSNAPNVRLADAARRLNTAYGIMVDSTKCKKSARSANCYLSCTFGGDFYTVVCDIQSEYLSIIYTPQIGTISVKPIEVYRITFSEFEQNPKLGKKTIRKVLMIDIPEYNKIVSNRYEELVHKLRTEIKSLILTPSVGVANGS